MNEGYHQVIASDTGLYGESQHRIVISSYDIKRGYHYHSTQNCTYAKFKGVPIWKKIKGYTKHKDIKDSLEKNNGENMTIYDKGYVYLTTNGSENVVYNTLGPNGPYTPPITSYVTTIPTNQGVIMRKVKVLVVDKCPDLAKPEAAKINRVVHEGTEFWTEKDDETVLFDAGLNKDVEAHNKKRVDAGLTPTTWAKLTRKVHVIHSV